MTKVAILGGGVGGMSAAHELIERGFEVVVYERKHVPGGKARSIWVPGTGTGGRRDLPGEHGFRFFPGFYKHLPDTMSRIPSPAGGSVRDRLVEATRFQIARDDGHDPVLVARFPRSIWELASAIRAIFDADLGIPDREWLFFAERLMEVLTSCDQRRLAELEHVSWWDFTRAATMSLAYRRYLVVGLTRSLVAMRAEEGSTRTVGVILWQLLQSVLTPGGELDRLLDGPTEEEWLGPWLDYLVARGVTYEKNALVKAIHVAGGVVSGVDVERGGNVSTEIADYYVSAVPVEQMRELVTPAMVAIDPRFEHLAHLAYRWMNGIQFFLDHDIPLVHGHTIYATSAWALTSISQAQFWRRPVTDYGDGTVRGVLSVDISDWDSPGTITTHLPARALATREAVKDEVWAQLKAELSPELGAELDAALRSWFLDDSIVLPNPSGAANLEPLLVNTVGSWEDRPDAVTRIPNLVLAADYVRTTTDLATMEAANEAARRAVNGILERTGSPAPRCRLWPLLEPAPLAPLKALDEVRFRHGKPNWFHSEP